MFEALLKIEIHSYSLCTFWSFQYANDLYVNTKKDMNINISLTIYILYIYVYIHTCICMNTFYANIEHRSNSN